jgi:hypothetical protein
VIFPFLALLKDILYVKTTPLLFYGKISLTGFTISLNQVNLVVLRTWSFSRGTLS